MQPEREFGEFDGHGVEIDAVHAALEDDAADDVLVVELIVAHGPAVLGGLGFYVGADGFDALHDGGTVFAQCQCGLRCFGDGFKGGVGEVVHERDEKVARSHGRIDDAQGQKGLGGVVTREAGQAFGFSACVGREFFGVFGKGGAALGEKRADGAAEDELNQFVGRVVAAGGFSREGVDEAALTQSAERAGTRGRMREMIEVLRAADVPPWSDEMGVILRDGAFQRAMRLVPGDEAQALWAAFDAEMERLYAVWAAAA